MIELAYGLLDPAATEAIRSHAANCAECSAAVSEATRAKGLFAKAAKMSFPEVKFEAPKNEVAAPKQAPKRTYAPWAIAASLLIVGGAVSVPLIQQGGRPKDGGGYVKVEPDKTGNGRGMLEDGNAKPPIIQIKSNEWTAKAAGAEPPFTIKVTGNNVLTAGVPNEYSVLAVDAKGKPAKVNIKLFLKDTDGKVLFEKEFVGYTIVRLPTIELKSSKLVLGVLATNAAGDKAEVSETIPVQAKQ